MPFERFDDSTKCTLLKTQAAERVFALLDSLSNLLCSRTTVLHKCAVRKTVNRGIFRGALGCDSFVTLLFGFVTLLFEKMTLLPIDNADK